MDVLESADITALILQVSGHQSSILMQDGRKAVIVLFDSTVTVWDLEKKEQVAVLQKWGQRDAASGHSGGVNAAYMTSDGKKVLTVSKDCTARIWDVENRETIHVLKGRRSAILRKQENVKK